MKLQDCEKLARKFLNIFGLWDWEFLFDRAKVRLGACHFQKQHISLSREFVRLNGEKICRDLILHEIAHALCGPKVGHGQAFKRKLAEIGGEKFSKKDVQLPLRKFTATCETCGQTFQAQRRRNVACLKCCRKFASGKFSQRFAFKFVKNAQEVSS